MMNQWLSFRGRFALAMCLAGLMTVLVSENRASAQEGQGRYVTEAAARLTKLIDASNKGGFVLQNNSFSIGGGWLKQSQTAWVPLFTVPLVEGKTYRFLAAGDVDAKDVDLEVQDANGKSVAIDTRTDPEAVVDFTPTTSGNYVVRIRLYDSDRNQPCVCLAVMMTKN